MNTSDLKQKQIASLQEKLRQTAQDNRFRNNWAMMRLNRALYSLTRDISYAKEVSRLMLAKEPSLLERFDCKHLKLYFAGDSIGAMAEGGAGGTVSYERALKGLKAFPNGTDESDTARLFLRYCGTVGVNQFSVTDWYAYHTKHRAATSYGKTWRDHFNTVEFILKKNGKLDYDHLVALSRDRGSNGNGCLALAYPIARMWPDCALRLSQEVTAGTHYLARPTMRLAVQFFLGQKTLDEVIDDPMLQEWGNPLQLTPLSHGCLYTAAIIAKEKRLKDVIRKALEIGNDVDSYLSLAMVMWGVRIRRCFCGMSLTGDMVCHLL